MYDRHSCHCVACAPARIADSRARKPLKHEWSDPAAARDRIALLRASGLSLDAIAELSGVNINQLRSVLSGRGRRPVKKVRRSTVDALCAIRAKDVAGHAARPSSKVDGTSAKLQLQALYCHGWSVESLGNHGRLSKGPLYRILAGENTTEEFRLKVDALHRDLAGHRAPHATEREQARAARAIAKATENNWTPDTEMAAERLLELALAA
jgi:lambda repressor-like predicted transcriptional regulator